MLIVIVHRNYFYDIGMATRIYMIRLYSTLIYKIELENYRNFGY